MLNWADVGQTKPTQILTDSTLAHCVKSVHIRSFSGPYFPVFGLKTERHFVSLHIQSECGKMRTRKTANTDTFHAVAVILILSLCCKSK